jgi:hypothetical protein
MKKTLEGGCLCGEIRYSVEGEVIDAGYCHCRVCQRASGAPAVAWFTVPVDSFNYSQGRPSAFRSSAQSQREFCERCGTQIAFRRGEHAVTVDISIASLDDPSLVEPEYHIWTESRIPWFETRDTLPRHHDSGPDANGMDEL